MARRKKLPAELEEVREKVIERLFPVVLQRVCEEGKAAARRDYATEDQQLLLLGSIRGFDEAARMVNGEHLAGLFEGASEKAMEALIGQEVDYWFWRGRASEIGWCCNVLGGIDLMEPVVMLTTNAFFQGIQILQDIRRGEGEDMPPAVELGTRTTTAVRSRGMGRKK
jgi:hypothetical protein